MFATMIRWTIYIDLYFYTKYYMNIPTRIDNKPIFATGCTPIIAMI